MFLPNLSVHHAHASPWATHSPTNVAGGPLQVGQGTLGAGCCSGHHHGGQFGSQLKDGDQEGGDQKDGDYDEGILGMTIISMTVYRIGIIVMVTVLCMMFAMVIMMTGIEIQKMLYRMSEGSNDSD